MEKPLWITAEGEGILYYLANFKGANVYEYQKDILLVEINGVKQLIRSLEELEILLAIYGKSEYNVLTPGESLLLDIGMNVGLTTFFFAAQPNVKKVVGFEPFPETYRCFLENLQFNPHLAGKIEHHNFGLGGWARDEAAEYSFVCKGGSGIFGLPEDIKNKGGWITTSIPINDAGLVLGDLCAKYSGLTTILKIDCEGAEYEIFANKGFGDVLGNVRVVLMEYHKHGHEELSKKLLDAGFQVLVCPGLLGINGMVYAFR